MARHCATDTLNNTPKISNKKVSPSPRLVTLAKLKSSVSPNILSLARGRRDEFIPFPKGISMT